MIIDGKKIADKILLKVRDKIEKKKLKVKLAVVLVGDDFASRVYVKRKQEACKKVGIVFELFEFPSEISELDLKNKINKIADSPDVSGILVQLPLPKHLDSEFVLKSIPENKNAESVSPVISAVEEIIKEYGVDLAEKKISLVGGGKLVGAPLGRWLNKKGLDFFDIDGIKKADIVISGVGKPKIITGEMVKEGVVVIDIGFSHDENGRAVGDVDFESVSLKAKLITPVPGGVGPITIACLLKNLVNG
ncbi:MAG: bifunctional 5,10-methylenetetrahydrofolate dehydrogenase/5,10-methenyltetrahydrofolate cyclohydrolase [bacterium]|nr:bifunctional 5,10-methylenetetrahydrofolate dehydrogenase/5,10-methenyltetrahydrofolate cyclohydrolase [bacterium]